MARAEGAGRLNVTLIEAEIPEAFPERDGA
jgi:hypothetical protein